jgi:peptidoglycan/LPS O-acetylase OafA/YrhL
MGLAVNALLLAGVAGTLAAVTYRYVEVPALRRKRATTVPGSLPGEPGEMAAVADGRNL